MMPSHALAMIQPWHPAMMYLIYCNVTEEDMVQQRIQNQPIPAGRLDTRLEPREAHVEVHVTMCICINVQHCGIACHTVHLRKHPCASILVLFRASRPSRARATLRAWNRGSLTRSAAFPMPGAGNSAAGCGAQRQAAGRCEAAALAAGHAATLW